MRKVAKVRLTNGYEVIAYILMRATISKSTALFWCMVVVKDLPGVRYHVVRGALDSNGVEKRRVSRSKCGVKRPKPLEVEPSTLDFYVQTSQSCKT